MLSFGNPALVSLLSAFAYVQAWTIDLPEVRQYYFAKYGKLPPKNEVSNVPLKEGQFIYNNYYSNSPHHEGSPGYVGPLAHGQGQDLEDADEEGEVMPAGQYAEDYEYQSYMEKKVNKIVSSGGRYLEGLRRAIEQYTRRLENCTTTNFTTLVSSGSYEQCKEATKQSEHVRRVAQLALHTTQLLQDRNYQEPREEKALLLRLALFLDTLTRLTGFEPDPADHLTNTEATPTSSSSLPPPPGIPLTSEQKQQLLDCMVNKENSPSPATERCKVPLPKALLDFYNITDANPSLPPSPSGSENSSAGTKPAPNQVNPRRRRSSKIPASIPETAKDQKPATDREAISKILQKKQTFSEDTNPYQGESDKAKSPVAVEDFTLENSSDGGRDLLVAPLAKLVHYYAKYKAWSNENPGLESGHPKVDFHDGNRLRRLVKRSAEDAQKLDQSAPASKTQKVPEDPMQDLSAYIRHRSQGYLRPDREQAERLKKYIQSLSETVRGRSKRSYRPHEFGYYRPYRARVPENPHQDISYYVKHKEGTEIRKDPVQAAQVRLGLEQLYQTGNILVVQRYGSNYNPLVPDQVSAGLLRSAADA